MSKGKPISFTHRDLYIEIGMNVAYYRKWVGMSQEELAERVEVSRTTISALEAPGMVKPISLELLFCLADALHVEPYKLLKAHE